MQLRCNLYATWLQLGQSLRPRRHVHSIVHGVRSIVHGHAAPGPIALLKRAGSHQHVPPACPDRLRTARCHSDSTTLRSRGGSGLPGAPPLSAVGQPPRRRRGRRRCYVAALHVHARLARGPCCTEKIGQRLSPSVRAAERLFAGENRPVADRRDHVKIRVDHSENAF